MGEPARVAALLPHAYVATSVTPHHAFVLSASEEVALEAVTALQTQFGWRVDPAVT